MIDAFGYEYGYTPQQTLGLPIIGGCLLVRRIEDRYPKAKGKKRLPTMSLDTFGKMLKGGKK